MDNKEFMENDVSFIGVEDKFQVFSALELNWIQPMVLRTGREATLVSDLVAVSDEASNLIANRFARQFKRELCHDHPPPVYAENHGSETTYLIRSDKTAHHEFDFYYGALGLDKKRDLAIITWIWVHPFARSNTRYIRGGLPGLVTRIDAELEEKVMFLHPLSKACQGLVKKAFPDDMNRIVKLKAN